MLHVYLPEGPTAEEELAFLRSHGIPFERHLPDLDAMRAFGAPEGEPVATDGQCVVVGFDPERLMALAADQLP